MHKHGEFETGTGRKVGSPEQAIATGHREAGPRREREKLKETERRERKGLTARQRVEGDGPSRTALYEEACKRDRKGWSRMSKAALERALAC